ncbi:elongation factor P--(R)-beta-lysine ligase [Thalassotalea ganghwensis]
MLTWKLAQQRADLLRAIREFFYARNIIEVDTPCLSQGTVTDVHLDAFECDYEYLEDNDVTQSEKLYLQTSPEFGLKRLLASGYGSIYYLGKAFRKEPFGRFHNPEFTMLEWYRVGFDHLQLMKEVEGLLTEVFTFPKAKYMTYQHAFLKHVNIDPLDCDVVTLKSYLSTHRPLDSWLEENDDIDTLLQFVFTEHIEPFLANDEPCFVYDFPRSQACLAKLSTKDQRVAERFECYYKGIELVNGFNELTDAEEQLYRFDCDNKARRTIGKIERPIDKRFISALQKGLPPCAGVALGVDRCLMIALNVNSITDVLTFPIESA